MQIRQNQKTIKIPTLTLLSLSAVPPHFLPVSDSPPPLTSSAAVDALFRRAPVRIVVCALIGQ